MFTEVIVMFTVLTCTSARTGHSTEGTYFVIPLAYEYELFGEWFMNIYTQEKHVSVNITSSDNLQTYFVSQARRLKVNVPTRIDANLGSVAYVKSNGFIRVFVTLQSKNLNSRLNGGFMVMSKSSCYLSYYVSTPPGYPFLQVLTFDYHETKITVKFPKDNVNPFKEKCFFEKLCEHGKKFIFKLKQYESWHFSVDRWNASFQNTLIVSNKPVYVVAGSIRCKMVPRQGDIDICMYSMVPTESWGKTYVVPHTVNPKLFRFNAENFPLSVKLYGSSKTNKNLKITWETQNQPLKLGDNDDIFLFISQVPFGLYLVFSPTRSNGEMVFDSSMLSLIPVELWMHGVYYNYLDVYSKNDTVFYLITARASEKSVEFKSINKNPQWKNEKTITVGEFSVNSGEVNFQSIDHARIITTDPKGKMLLLVHERIARRSVLDFPYNFYQSVIHHHNCKPMSYQGRSDGVDNDCDGQVDEEVDNELDDDDDYRVDEDVIAPNRDGWWGEWTNICNVTYKKKVYSVDARTCRDQSSYGKFCEGDDVQCNRATCPRILDDSGGKGQGGCFCNICKKCSSNIFQCDECKPGVLPDLHCIQPCPRGWKGVGCTESAIVKRNERNILTIIFITLAVILFIVVWIVVVMFLKSVWPW